ncbi:hypothetical protein ACIRRH_40290 [Kitasatospora sp. NPDC101235]|uniref:hypothetical protein n=1 Tax=Kitasatospora sp. NPDC101235 TaxID=3364101 RepID=UPI00380E9155
MAAGLPTMPGYYQALPTVMGPWHTTENPAPAASLADEVDRLVVYADEAGAAHIDGIARRPGPSLANRLEELAGHR